MKPEAQLQTTAKHTFTQGRMLNLQKPSESEVLTEGKHLTSSRLPPSNGTISSDRVSSLVE